jgi:hypothetical protein
MLFIRSSMRPGGALALAAFALVASAVPALAVDVPSSAALPLPGFLGAGLDAEGRNAAVNTTADAFATIAVTPADFTFTAANIDYPNGDGFSVVNPTGLGFFLGTDGASLSGFQDEDVAGTILLLRGFIAIAEARTVSFAVNSDDGFRLTIGGVQISEFPGDRGPDFTFGDATFSAAGLYPIELAYYANNAGLSGLTFYSTLGGGSTVGPAPQGYTLVPAGILYAVPSPGAAGLALLGLSLAARRSRP